MRVTTSQYETSGKNNAHLLSHDLPAGEKIHWNKQHFGRGKCRVLPTDPICQVVTGTAVIFHLAGQQNRQYVSPLIVIIYNVLS